jgi:hypothetical protein
MRDLTIRISARNDDKRGVFNRAIGTETLPGRFCEYDNAALLRHQDARATAKRTMLTSES